MDKREYSMYTSVVSPFKHQYHPVGRVVDVFCKSEKSSPNVEAVSTSQSPSQPQHGTQAGSGVVEADSMSSNGTPQLPGVSSNGSSVPEARTSFQSSTPRAVLTTSPSSRPSLGETDPDRDHIKRHLSRDDSISEELAHFSSDGNISPLLASTPVRGTADGRNLSLTKMLMSSDQFRSIADFCSSDSDTTTSVHSSSGMEERPVPPKSSPSRENLRNIGKDGSIPLEKQTSITHLNIPPARLDPSSSANVIEKYSAPGALSDFAHPYVLERPSTESTRSLKLPGLAFSEFCIDEGDKTSVVKSMSKRLPTVKTEVDREKGLSSLDSRSNQQDDEIQLQRLGSEVKIRTIYDAENVPDDKKDMSQTRSANTEKGGAEKRVESGEKSEKKVFAIPIKYIDKNDTTDKGNTCISDIACSIKAGGPLGRGSSISEFKTAASLLHEKQRKIIEKKIIMTKEIENMAKTGKLPKSSKREEKNSDTSKSHSLDTGKFDIDSKSSNSERRPMFRSLESDVFSHLSGMNYTPPQVHLQRHLDRQRNGAENTNSLSHSKIQKISYSGHTTDSSVETSKESLQDDNSEENLGREADHKLVHPVTSHEIRSVDRHIDTVNSALEKEYKQSEHGEAIPEEHTENSAYAASTTSKLLQKTGQSSPDQSKQSISSLPDYTTPSQLLKKYQEFERGHEKSQGYGAFDYSTPSKLLEKHEKICLSSQRESALSIPDYTTPSQLLRKRQESEGGQENSPGYGAFDYSTPSKMLERQEQIRNRRDSESSKPDYTSPSQLLKKREEREKGQENSPGYGAFDYSTPSNMLDSQEQVRNQRDSVSSIPDYTTPSQLLKKHEEREKGQEKSPEYGTFDSSTPSKLLNEQDTICSKEKKESISSLPEYTTPSQLLKKHQESEGGHEKSPGYGAFDYSTPSNMLERQEQVRNQRDSVSSIPDYTTQSQLLKKREEREKGQEKSHEYGTFDSSTPSKLLNEQDTICSKEKKESISSLPEYTTPSQLLKKHQESEGGHEKSPGYGAFDYSTPSNMLESQEQVRNQRESVSSIPDYTTPSQLLKRREEREKGQENSPGYGAIDYSTPSNMLERQEQVRNHRESVSSIPDYTTPSQLLKRREEREKGQENSPGYGAFDYSTPSKLLNEQDTICSKEKKESISSLPEYTTPSQLLKKHQESEGGHEKSPGYGAFDYSTPSNMLERQEQVRNQRDSVSSIPDYTTPSQLLKKREEREKGQEKNHEYGTFDSSTPSKLLNEQDTICSKEKKESMSSLPEYTTPSQLLKKHQESEGGHEKSPGYGAFDYSTPSNMLESQEQVRNYRESVSSIPDYTTPSQLLKRREEREKGQENSPGYGAFDYSTPSNMLERQEQVRNQNNSVSSIPDYTTPSQLLKKHDEREKKTEYGTFDYSTPSYMLERQEQVRNQRESVSSIPDYTTPSQLLKRREEREKGQENSPGYGAFDYSTPSNMLERQEQVRNHRESVSSIPDYTTPSQLLKRREEREKGQENSPGYGAFDYSTPSKLLKATASDRTSVETDADTKGSLDTVDRGLLQETPSRPAQKNVLDRAMSDLTTYYFRRMSEILRRATKNSQSSSEPELMKLCSQLSCDESYSAMTLSNESGSSFSSQRKPMLSQQLSTCFCGSDIKGQHRLDCKFSKSDVITDSSRNTSRDTGFESNRNSISSLSYPDSFLSAQESRFKVVSNPSFDACSDEEHHAEDQRTDHPSTSSGPHSALSVNEMFWELYSANPGLANQVLGPEFAAAIKSLGRLYRGSYSSLSTIPSVATTPASSDYPITTASNPDPPATPPSVSHEKSPGYGAFDYSTPSNMLERQEQVRNQRDSVSSIPDYTTPSQLLKKREEREKGQEKNHEYGTFDSSTLPPSFTQPSQHSQAIAQDDYVDIRADGSRSDGQMKSSSSMAASPRSASPDIRNFLVEKEKMESQMRKLQVENSTLFTENKLIKEKFNRATARIGELEQKVYEAQDEMEAFHTSMTAEFSSLCDKTRAESKHDMEQLQARVVSLTHHNESLQSEVSHLGKQLVSAHRELDIVRDNADKSRAVDGFKLEIQCLKNEVEHVKQLLQQSETQLRDEMEHAREAHLQVIKLTEVRNLLQQQLEAGGTGTSIAEKQVQALEQRLRLTEDRLHQERGDRANTLSAVEEKLLAENARLQSTEKEVARKLQREKDKARNLDQRCRELKVENENLRLALPLDESCLIKDNNYDIPNNINSSHRQETKQISDIKYILSEVEREAGLTAGQETEIICHLWNTSNQAQRRLRQWEINLQDLEVLEEDVDQGLQNLREMKGEYEVKMREVEEKIEDIRSEKIGFENMYKEQLSGLVKEKHEACARLKTLEDMMDALRKENDILRLGLAASTEDSNMEKITADHDAHIEALSVEIRSLEGKTSQLQRDSQTLQAEVETLKAQLTARDSELEETRSELEVAKCHAEAEESDNRKQQKIDQLTAQANSLQDEVRSLSERLGITRAENSRLERQLEDATRQLAVNKTLAKEFKAGESTAAKVSLLESGLAQKDSELIRMTSQYHEVDTELQHTKQDLFFHQQHISDLEAQVESLQQQLVQRGQLLETVSGKEREQLQQFQMVKDSLDAVTNSLNQRTAEFKVVQTDLSRERSRREALEKQVRGEQHPHNPDADVVSPSVGSAMEIRVRELEAQADRLRGDLVESASVLQGKEEELSLVRTELAHTRDDLDREKGLSCQVAAEKVTLQQQLQAVVEDRNCLHEEKDQAEEDLVKLESKLQEVVHKFQMDSTKQHNDFSTTYGEPESSEGKQMLSELKSLRLLIDGKEKEAESLNDRIRRLQMETGFLHRRVELLRQENQYNKEDVHRLSQELITKIKEKAATADLNMHLMREKSNLQQENHQLVRDIEREKDYTERRKAEVSEVISKMEKSESSQRSTVQELHQREGDLASLETDLRQARKENAYLETENQQLKAKVDHFKDEVQKLTSIGNTLDNRLEMERASLVSEKTNYNKKKEELTSTQHKFDALQREQSMLLNNLSAERKMVEQLRSDLSSLEASEKSLSEKVNSLQVNLDSQQGQNLALRENLEQAKKEKTCIFNDYQDVCRQLGEKEKNICDLTGQCERQVDSVRRDAAIERTGLDQERAAVERDLAASKEEINELNEKLRQKDIQLKAFGRTLTDLEDTTREKKSLEMKLEKLESATGESKLLLESHRAEIFSLKDANARLQESLTKTQVNYHSVQEQLKSQTDSNTGQVMHLKQQLSDLKNQQEGERVHLREALNQVEANLHSVEKNLKNTTENRDQVVSENKKLERSLEEIRGQLSEEIMTRKLLEQKTESQKTHLESLRKKKQTIEEKLAELQAKMATRDSELRMERERVMTLTSKVQDFEASAHGNQSAAMAKHQQVEILQSEVGKLQQLLDSQKHQLGGKFRKANLELKQQLESSETEKTKLAQEAQQLSVSLEQAREQVAIKNKENLKLQEDILLLEDQVRDNSSQLKQAQESLRMEEHLQSDLNTRFSAQEEELKRLRTFLAKKAEEGGDGESKGMWQEMNRVIQDLSREMHQHMEGQQNSDKEARDREIKLANSYKKQISKLDSELNTERALHQITRSSVSALEEDNARLRQQLHLLRRKSSTPEKKHKSRSEEINEIIARSQSRAHAMLSSGSYLDGTFRNINPTRDYNTNSHPLDRSQSPDTASQISDISFGSTSPVYLAFLNSSGNLPGSGNVTPRKSPR